MMMNDRFKPAKKKGWEKIQATKDITTMVGSIRILHHGIMRAMTDGRLADALDGSLKATLKLQETARLFKDMRLGRYGYDLRALIDKIEQEDRDIWPLVLRTTKESLGLI